VLAQAEGRKLGVIDLGCLSGIVFSTAVDPAEFDAVVGVLERSPLHRTRVVRRAQANGDECKRVAGFATVAIKRGRRWRFCRG